MAVCLAAGARGTHLVDGEALGHHGAGLGQVWTAVREGLMKRRSAARLGMLALGLLVLGGCGGGGGGGGVALAPAVQGAVQKGPFAAGSTVTFQGLDATLTPTGPSFELTVSNGAGEFSFPLFPLTTPFVEVVASGVFRSELTGTMTTVPLTLRALVPSSQLTSIRVNVFTTLVTERIRTLVGGGATFAAAVAQAEAELLATFGLGGAGLPPLGSLDLAGATSGSGALIATSVLLLQVAATRAGAPAGTVAELALLLSNLANDLAPDGVISLGGGLQAELQAATGSLNPVAIAANLIATYLQLGRPIVIPDLSAWVALFGTI